MNWIQLLSSDRIGKKSKGDESFRSDFEKDYDRIIFSHPFRRLQDKTQVHPLPEYDFVHTRLTHSLEVSSVGRSLGKKVGEVLINRYPELKKKGINSFDFGAIVAAAALAHDIGNPPFGHSGESAISDFFKHHPQGELFKSRLSDKQWEDAVNFEGNAQGFRLMQQNQGLQLTFATLASFTKYPRESKITQQDKSKKSQKKYGFFQSEKEAFAQVAQEVGLLRVSDKDLIWNRHPLAFLVEAADDICYQVIDLEDGCRLGLVGFDETVALFAKIIGENFDRKKLDKYSSNAEKIGILRAMAISILVDQCVDVFLANEKLILEGAFDKAITGQIKSSNVLDEIEKISITKIYQSRKVMEKEAAGFEVLPGLLESFSTAAYNYYFAKEACSRKHSNLMRLLPEDIKVRMDNSQQDVYAILMACIDFISGMTDSAAISLYRKIKGISLPEG
ncbi:MAG: deoxyguanosinetriphosphate triphosphohydrolase [Cyclobacteriaceae bacterium]|nr:deoxyguanosinetriphosphate triphosphohydrolase [Cyclobacteriaceae bacterium]